MQVVASNLKMEIEKSFLDQVHTHCTGYLVLVLVLVVFPGVTMGYGTGAPKSACTTLRPGHSRTSPQTRTSPYRIDVGSITSYTPGQSIPVRITGGVFGGFLLQARPRNTSTPVGYFHHLPPSTKFTSCDHPDDSFTHADATDKEDLAIMWTAPDAPVAEIEFLATVARNRQTYWIGLRSRPLKLHSARPNEHVITAVTSQWPDMFTSANFPEDPSENQVDPDFGNPETVQDNSASSISTRGLYFIFTTWLTWSLLYH